MRNDEEEEGRMRNVSVFTALGIDMQGRKSTLGFWIIEGGGERGIPGEMSSRTSSQED
jgi:transposase-like protein